MARVLLLMVSLAAGAAVFAADSSHASNWDHYIGEYPCAGRDKFFGDAAVNAALGAALGDQVWNYEKFRKQAGCGAIGRFSRFLFVDISMVHINGYSSMVLFDPATKSAYVFWVHSPINEWKAKTYGVRPVPPEVLAKFADEMNIKWGHVAAFGVVNGDVAIVGEGEKLLIR